MARGGCSAIGAEVCGRCRRQAGRQLVPWDLITGSQATLSILVPKPNRNPLILFRGTNLAGTRHSGEEWRTHPEDKRDTSNTQRRKSFMARSFQTLGRRGQGWWQTWDCSTYLVQTDVQGHPQLLRHLMSLTYLG